MCGIGLDPCRDTNGLEHTVVYTRETVRKTLLVDCILGTGSLSCVSVQRVGSLLGAMLHLDSHRLLDVTVDELFVKVVAYRIVDETLSFLRRPS